MALVIAHPDDEAMFFVPSILALQGAGHSVQVLCFSRGGYLAGQERVRPAELLRSCQRLRIPAERVEVLDFGDGPEVRWSGERIADALDRYVEGSEAEALVTFDEGGVSGHPNHVALHAGVLYWRSRVLFRGQRRLMDVEAWALQTTGLLRKYAGLLDVVLSALLDRQRYLLLFNPLAFFFVFMAMRAHASQLLWFRYLFICFSRYSFMNTLTRLF